MSRNFDIRYRWTLDDYRVLSEAQARLTRTRRISQSVFWVFVAGLIVTGIIAVLQGERFWAVYFLGLGLLLFSIRVLLAPALRRRQFAHQHLGEYEIEFKADEDGFATRTEVAESQHKWASIRRVDNKPEHVLLWPNSRMGWMVPKRAFSSAAEAEAFAALAKEKTHGQTL